MNYSEFVKPDIWTGGYYELSMEFHPFGDDKQINSALTALQNCGCFKGLWQIREDFGSSPLSLPIKIHANSVNQLYGTLTSSDGNILPCVISVIRTTEESDWLDISIPQAFLEKIYPYQYPLTRDSNPWLVNVDAMFTRLVEIIYGHSPFDLAMIGEEISGYTNQATITYDCLKKITCILPLELQKRLGMSEKGEALSNDLRLIGGNLDG